MNELTKWKLKRLREELSLYVGRCEEIQYLLYLARVVAVGIHRTNFVVHNPCSIFESAWHFTNISKWIIKAAQPFDDRTPSEYP